MILTTRSAPVVDSRGDIERCAPAEQQVRPIEKPHHRRLVVGPELSRLEQDARDAIGLARSPLASGCRRGRFWSRDHV